MATFECEVSHLNVPSTWLKDGVELEMSEKLSMVVQGKVHQLRIMNCSRDDSAEYTFVCGSDRVSATLTVNRKFPELQGSLDALIFIQVFSVFSWLDKDYYGYPVSTVLAVFSSILLSESSLNLPSVLLFSSHPHNNNATERECSGERSGHV